MGRGHVHMGPVGSGALLKLINDFMCGVQLASLGEAIAMAQRSGLDVRRTADVLAGGSPGSPIVKMVVERMVSRDYTPNFLVPLMVKDLTTPSTPSLPRASSSPMHERRANSSSRRSPPGYQGQDIASWSNR